MTRSDADLVDWLFARPGQDRPDRSDARFAGEAAWIEAGRALPDADARLANLLGEDGDTVTRSAAALALGMLGDAKAAAPLTAALGDEPVVAMEAAAALGRLRATEAVEPLCAALASKSANVRANAAQALARIGGSRAAECIEMVRDDPDAMVRNAAAAAERQERGV